MISPLRVGRIEKLGDKGAPSLSELADRLRGDLLAEGARQERERLRNAVNEECTCGGNGPDDPNCCLACKVWHRMKEGA